MEKKERSCTHVRASSLGVRKERSGSGRAPLPFDPSPETQAQRTHTSKVHSFPFLSVCDPPPSSTRAPSTTGPLSKVTPLSLGPSILSHLLIPQTSVERLKWRALLSFCPWHWWTGALPSFLVSEHGEQMNRGTGELMDGWLQEVGCSL